MSKAIKQDGVKEQFPVIRGENNEWEIYNKRNKKVPIKIITTKHKYGKDMSYQVVSYYDKESKKSKYVVVHRLVWCGMYGDIKEGYDVDHVNDNPLDNRLENLQLLTHAENIKKRGIGRNQYTYNLTDKEILELRSSKNYYANERRKHWDEYKDYINEINEDIRALKLLQKMVEDDITKINNCHLRKYLRLFIKDKIIPMKDEKYTQRNITYKEGLKINYNVSRNTL